MRVARGSRSIFRPFFPLAGRRSSGTCPAVLQRHLSTSNRFTGETQSLLALSPASVSLRPSPRGLITPAATTATRVETVFPSKPLNLRISVPSCPRFCLLSQPEHLTQCARKEKTAARKSADCHLKFISGDLKFDKRE